MIQTALFILYVKDQAVSSEFYSAVLNQKPALDVPGMTEFRLAANCIFGIMPEKGIKKLLGKNLPDPSKANGIPRCELYLIVDNPQEYHNRALDRGAREISPLQTRSWGDRTAYCMDPDGHVIAFAEQIK